jgi:hypothetical protein
MEYKLFDKLWNWLKDLTEHFESWNTFVKQKDRGSKLTIYYVEYLSEKKNKSSEFGVYEEFTLFRWIEVNDRTII